MNTSLTHSLTHSLTKPLAAVLIAALVFVAGSTQAATIYYDSFSDTGALNGSTPDTTIGTNTWAATADWQKSGGTVSHVNAVDSGAFLPFTPDTGTVYTLSADMTPPTSDKWTAIGFADTNNTTGEFWANDAAPWVLYRRNSNVGSFLGPRTGGSEDEGDHSGPITLSIVLDTTAAAWTAEWFIDGSSVRGPVAYGTNPTINYVGLGSEDTDTGTFDNFTLTEIPEPASAVLLGSAVLGLICLRRRK